MSEQFVSGAEDTLIHVYAIENRSTLFDVTFERLYSGVAFVQYR